MSIRPLGLFPLVLVLVVLCGQQVAPGPGVYKGRRIATTMHYLGVPWLVRESREREEECSAFLRILEVAPGHVVCDLGCGNGFYTLPLAERVGASGRVLAVDIQPEMLDLLTARVEGASLSGRVEPILGTLTDPKLPEGVVDLVLMVDVYHELSHPERMLAELRRSLAPRGRIVLVEFREEDPDVPIKSLHKMSKRQILKELPPNGFRLVAQFDGLPWQHVMFFERAPDDDLTRAARAALLDAARRHLDALPASLRRRIFTLTGEPWLLDDDAVLFGTPEGIDGPAPPASDVRRAIEAVAIASELEPNAALLCDHLERTDGVPAPTPRAGAAGDGVDSLDR